MCRRLASPPCLQTDGYLVVTGPRGSRRSRGRLVGEPIDSLRSQMPRLAGQPVGHAGEDGWSGLLPSGGERRAETCVARPCGIPSWLASSFSTA